MMPGQERAGRGDETARKDTWLRAVLSLLLLWALARPAAAIETTIYLPASGDERIDICLHWGTECSGEAADVYCKVAGFDKATEWEVEYDIGAKHPTVVLGDGKTCRSADCDGYYSITCVREDDWTRATGHGGLLVKIMWQREINPPTGALVIAVSEDGSYESAAAVVDRDGIAMLHTRPGKYRIYIEDWENTKPVGRPARKSVEVYPGKDGFYLEWMIDAE